MEPTTFPAFISALYEENEGVLHTRRKQLAVRLVRSERSTIELRVSPDLEVTLKAPAEITKPQLQDYFERRYSWLFRQIEYFEALRPYPSKRRGVSGETYFVAGRQYKLSVNESNEVQAIQLSGKLLEVDGLAEESDALKSLLTSFYYGRAVDLILPRVEQLKAQHDIFNDVVSPTVALKTMAYRWGSCSKGGKIMLTPYLVMLPQICIDYVILHELLHLLIPNHGEVFWRQLEQLQPEIDQAITTLAKHSPIQF